MDYIELEMIMAQIAQRFGLEAVPDHRVELEAGTTMYARDGLQMTLHPLPAVA